jgi:acyl-CoA synthetase (AMP-forming)/AMP-acid ligase II
MEKHWLKSYPEGVPHEVHPEQYRSLTQLLEESFKKNAARPFSVCMERWMSYAQLDAYSAALGAWLQAQGLEPGARVAIMLPNIPQFPVTMAAVLRAGYTCVNVNPLYTARELEHQLKDSGATAIVILENFAKTLEEVIERTAVKHVVMASMGDLLGFWYGLWITFAVRHLAKMVPEYKLPLSAGRTVTPFNRAIAEGTSRSLASTPQTLDSIAFLQYTGGTTGLSKGAELTHRNIVAAILQAEAWFTPALKRMGDPGKTNSIAALPLYHIFALTLCLLAIRWGAHMTLIPNPRDFSKFIEVLKKRPFHLFPAVNTLFNALLQHPQFKSIDFSHLCLSQAGGMAASEGTARQWQQATGCPMVEGWGMSETCAIGTNNVVTSKTFTGTIGLPLPSIEIAIKDDDGKSLPVGESGEICIKGPNVMRGYYNQPAENEKAFTADGFMRTGDIGIIDADGYTKIVDRKKDMILVSGFNVFPNELENVISLCPGVVECAAIGIPDEKQGEAIKVFVVKNDPTLAEEDVAKYCRQNLTGYKVPKYIEFRDDLPKTNVGKILRRELRSAKS